MDFSKRCRVNPGKRFTLARFDPADTAGFRKNHKMKAELQRVIERLDSLQYLLYAECKHALLIVLQAPDTGGKDGTIRHVMTGFNPQGTRVTSFKVPTDVEKAHDFLWRIHDAIPARGQIGIFNRSHYEDVLAVRVHNLVPEHVWSRRYEQINQFEQYLAENNVTVLKFFLHISKDEQKKRLQSRLDSPDKGWKLSLADFEERKFWSQYQTAYADALSRCSTSFAPWFVIPSNHKWFRNLAVSHIILKTLESLHMKFPPPSFDISKFRAS